MTHRVLLKPYIVLITLICLVLGSCSEEETYYEPVKYPKINIKQVGYSENNAVTVQFTPDAFTHHFMYAIGTEADFENFENGTLNSIKTAYGNESLEHTFEYLNPSAGYVIFARAYNVNDESGAVSSIKIKTITDAFSVKTQFVADKSIGFTVQHTDDYYKFHYYLGKAGEREKFQELADADNKDLPVCIEKAPEYSRYFFDLTPQTDYVFYVRGYDRSNVPTKIFEIPVTTKIEDSVPGVYNFKINSMDLFMGNFQFTFNDNTGKAAVLIEEQENFDIIFDGWRGDIFGMLKNWAIGGNIASTTSKVYNFSYQTPDLLLSTKTSGGRSPFEFPFTAYVLLYDKDGEPYAIDRVKYTSPSYNDNAPEPDVEVQISGIIPHGVQYTFIPNEHTKCLFYETFYAKYIDEGINFDGGFDGIPTDEQLIEVVRSSYFHYGSHSATYPENTTGYAGVRLCLVVLPLNENGFFDIRNLKRYYYTAE